MRSVQERETNILRRFKVTPISPLPLLVAAMACGWLLYLPVLFILVGLAHFLYAMPMPQNWFSLFVMASLGVCALRAIGLILAAVTNTMQEATIAIQVLYMPALEGATAHVTKWAQTVAHHAGLSGNRLQDFFRNQTLGQCRCRGARCGHDGPGTFLAMQLFRWRRGKARAAQPFVLAVSRRL
jgi:hypothetical protein